MHFLSPGISLYLERCIQPAQQQGRRIPARSFDRPTSIRRCRVSGFLASRIQQIHSLRASGVISSQRACALGVSINALRQSAGTVCTTPVAILFLVITLSIAVTRRKLCPLSNQYYSLRERSPY